MVCDDFHNSLRDELGDYTMCLVMIYVAILFIFFFLPWIKKKENEPKKEKIQRADAL